MTDSREHTTIRRRQAELAEALDRDRGDTLAQGPALLVKVFAETTIPTAALKYFACHPVKIGGVESEGTAPTFTADADQTLYVAVLGNVPVAGDYLIARLVGGRWVAGAGTSTCVSACTAATACFTNWTGATVTFTSRGIASFTVTSGGGYTSPPTVVIATTNGSGGSATAVLVGGAVDHIDVNSPGTYTVAPLISFTGGGGSGAAATSTLTGATTYGPCTTNGQITSITRTAAGSGYTSVPSVTIAPPASGTTATAVAVLSTAAVASITLVGGGSGYTDGTGYTLAFTGGGSGGGFAAGTFDVAGGVVTAVHLTAGGSGYDSAPTLGFPGAGGSGATGTATLATRNVVSFTVTDPGNGYTTVPAVTVAAPPSGTTATGTAVRTARCCVALPTAGTYSRSVSATGFDTNTATVAFACGAETTATVTLNPAAGYSCQRDPCCPTADQPTAPFPILSSHAQYFTNDGFGLITMNRVGTTNVWLANVQRTATPAYTDCNSAATATTAVTLAFQLSCLGGSTSAATSWQMLINSERCNGIVTDGTIPVATGVTPRTVGTGVSLTKSIASCVPFNETFNIAISSLALQKVYGNVTLSLPVTQ